MLEWVRDSVLARDFQELEKYFPPGQGRSILTKWKDIPKQLKRNGLIPSSPDLSGQVWADFDKLVRYRHGLVHASSSRPETEGLEDERLPVPSKSTLDDMKPGWPTIVVSELIIQLSEAAATPIPDWLEEP